LANRISQAPVGHGARWVMGDSLFEAVGTFHMVERILAYWGLAYAVGPNYNKPWEKFDQGDLHTCVQRGYNSAYTGFMAAA
jgi:hypothetical protein